MNEQKISPSNQSSPSLMRSKDSNPQKCVHVKLQYNEDKVQRTENSKGQLTHVMEDFLMDGVVVEFII